LFAPYDFFNATNVWWDVEIDKELRDLTKGTRAQAEVGFSILDQQAVRRGIISLE